MEQMQQVEMTKQAGQFASAPMMDPSKNPNLLEDGNEPPEAGQAPGSEAPNKPVEQVDTTPERRTYQYQQCNENSEALRTFDWS